MENPRAPSERRTKTAERARYLGPAPSNVVNSAAHVVSHVSSGISCANTMSIGASRTALAQSYAGPTYSARLGPAHPRLSVIAFMPWAFGVSCHRYGDTKSHR